MPKIFPTIVETINNTKFECRRVNAVSPLNIPGYFRDNPTVKPLFNDGQRTFNTQLTISDMIELYHRGESFEVLDNKELELIFNYLEIYLQNMKKYIGSITNPMDEAVIFVQRATNFRNDLAPRMPRIRKSIQRKLGLPEKKRTLNDLLRTVSND